MSKIKTFTCIWISCAAFPISHVNAANLMSFEGLQNNEPILSYYSGGTGGFGSKFGLDYGVTFGSSALAIIDADAGGSGNFGGEPSPSTAMYFLTGSAVLNAPAGFSTGFSFSYTAINQPGKVIVYDGLNAKGNILSSIDLPVTPSNGGDPTGAFSPFYSLGAAFEGTARSVDFSGTVNQIGFDNITIGSVTPGTEANIPFLIGDQATNPAFSSRFQKLLIDDGVQWANEFDSSAPTYVVSHGWQPDANYTDDGWNFATQLMPEGQADIKNKIWDRISIENEFRNEIDIKANILMFEWEGAYTGGGISGARKARSNADYAGVLLGNALQNTLGSDYRQDIHFIGHSYGTVVNGLATRYLEGQGALRNAADVQFTVLDAPTEFDSAAPRLPTNWFTNNLSRYVDYVDNYFGESLVAFGERVDGAGINQEVNYGHSGVASPFYSDLIVKGSDANTNPNGDDSGKFTHLFKDWITPVLGTYDDRPGRGFSIDNTQWAGAVSPDFISALGDPIAVASLPGYDSYIFSGILLREQSPVSAYQFLQIPLWAEWIAFDWIVGSGGDGDWITVHFESDWLWSMAIDELLEGVLLNAFIDISQYAGKAGNLYFSLNSVGAANADFYFGNIEFRGSRLAVPEPSIVALLMAGLVAARIVARRRKVTGN